MNTHERGTHSTSLENTGHAEAARRIRSRIAWLGLIAMIPVAVALLAYGCGHQPSDDTSASAGGGTPALESAASTNAGTQAVQAAASTSGPPVAGEVASSGPQSVATTEAASGTLPPDIVASVADTLVEPGETVEVLVEATPDVAEIALWDGLSQRTAFTYDSTAKAWLALYRVPLRPSQDRVGLSVTAKSQGNRWRRVWVFLRVQRETPATDHQ